MAYWHHPLSSAPKLKDMWQDLYDAGADFVLDGHVHGYKKPVARNASGVADPNGPREVVVGSGGKSSGVYGLLKLTLHADSADWRFVGSGATDSGTATCHGTATPPAAGQADRELLQHDVGPGRHVHRHVDRGPDEPGGGASATAPPPPRRARSTPTRRRAPTPSR